MVNERLPSLAFGIDFVLPCLAMPCHALPCLAMPKGRQGMARHGKAWQGMARRRVRANTPRRTRAKAQAIDSVVGRRHREETETLFSRRTKGSDTSIPPFVDYPNGEPCRYPPGEDARNGDVFQGGASSPTGWLADVDGQGSDPMKRPSSLRWKGVSTMQRGLQRAMPKQRPIHKSLATP